MNDFLIRLFGKNGVIFLYPQCEGQVNVDKAKKNLKVIFTIANSEFQCPSLSTAAMHFYEWNHVLDDEFQQ